MRVGLSWAAIGGIAWVTCACSALLDTSSLGPGAEDAGASAVAGGGSSASAGASSAGEAAGGAPAGGAPAGGAPAGGAPAGGAPAGGAPSNCTPTDKKELCDGLDNDCDSSTPDECPSGCVGFTDQNRGYMECSKPVTFTAAQLACLNQNMFVASPQSASRNLALYQRVAHFGVPVWLGAQDEQPNHTLKWPTGTVLATNGVPNPNAYTNFADGQPVVLGGQNCLRMSTRSGADAGKWSSTACSDQAPFVCEPFL